MSQQSPEEYFGEPSDYVLFTRLGAIGLESLSVAFVMLEPLATRMVGVGGVIIGALLYADGTRVKDAVAGPEHPTEGSE